MLCVHNVLGTFSSHKKYHVFAAGNSVSILFNSFNMEKAANALVSSSRTIPQEETLDGLALVRRTSSRLAENKKQTVNSEHLDEAISTIEQTLAVGGECLQPLVLGDLGAMLYKRFQRTGSLDDLNRAIDAVGQAIDATSEGISDQALYLRTLGTWLRTRYERTALVGDLNRSVEVSSPAANNENNDMPSVAGGPEGETIYANTPQHHGTVLLLQMSDGSGTGVES